MSEMISDVFGQWRSRTITGSSRQATSTADVGGGASAVSTMSPHSILHGVGGGGDNTRGRDEMGVVVRSSEEASSFLPVAASSQSSHEVGREKSLDRSLLLGVQRSKNNSNDNNNNNRDSNKNVSSSSRCRQQGGSSSNSINNNYNNNDADNSSSDRPSIKSVVKSGSRRRHRLNNGSSKVLYSKSNSCANSSKSVHGFNLVSVILAQTLILMCSVCCSSKVYNVHWNTSNPIFRIDNTDHIIDVNRDNLPYDQVNIICPVYQPGTKEEDAEKYIIYNVSKEEYDTCRITNPNPRIIAVCDKPFKLMYFTITFRSFTPQPGGLEFRPGQDYYFISTSSRDDLHRRVGGRCSSHNMKVVFKVCCHPGETSSQSSTSAPALPQIPRFSTPRASTASSATLSPRRPFVVYNSSSSSAASSNNPNIYGSRINNGSISINDHYDRPRTQDPLYNSNNIGGGYGGGGGNGGGGSSSSSSSSSPASTSTTNIPPQPFPAHPPVTRYPPKKTQYTNNPNYKPPSKKKELEKHPNEVVKNEELTSGAASSSLTAGQTTTLVFLTLSTILVTRRIQSPAFHWSVR